MAQIAETFVEAAGTGRPPRGYILLTMPDGKSRVVSEEMLFQYSWEDIKRMLKA